MTETPTTETTEPVHHTMTADTGYLTAESQPALADTPAAAEAISDTVPVAEPAPHASWVANLWAEIKRVVDHVLPHHADRGDTHRSAQAGAAVDAAHQALRGGDRAEIEQATENLKAHQAPSA